MDTGTDRERGSIRTTQKQEHGFRWTMRLMPGITLPLQSLAENSTPQPAGRLSKSLIKGSISRSTKLTLVIGGGESGAQKTAHREVEAFDTRTRKWINLPRLNRGRHGAAFAIIGDYLYTASGCGNRGGSPELLSLERLKLPIKAIDSFDVVKGQTKTLSFTGPETSENATPNPFTDYRLMVKFSHPDSKTAMFVRGFYAADGNAANTSANSGNIWQARFAPNRTGVWNYSASLHHGKDIAIGSGSDSASTIELPNSKGSFLVGVNQTEGSDFRSRNRIVADKNGYFRHENTENLLAYADFDGTFRIQASNEDGEASTDDQIHRYETHVADWTDGDPTWGEVQHWFGILAKKTDPRNGRRLDKLQNSESRWRTTSRQPIRTITPS